MLAVAAHLPVYPKHHLVPDAFAGRIPLTDARCALRQAPVSTKRDHSLYLSCSAVKAVDGVRVFDEANDERPIIVTDNYDSCTYNLCQITACTEDGLIMAARHKKYKHIQGVQFPPESVITTEGKRILHNFLMFMKEFESDMNPL